MDPNLLTSASNAQAGHLSSIRIAMCIGNFCVFILNHAQGLLINSKMWKLLLQKSIRSHILEMCCAAHRKSPFLLLKW